MKYRSRTKTAPKKKISKKRLLIFLLLFFIVIIIFLTIKTGLLNNTNLEKNVFKQEDSFSSTQINNSDSFYTLIFSVNDDSTISKISFTSKSLSNTIDINKDLYFVYDNNYYQFKNIINAFKLNRSEESKKNFIPFLQSYLGIKIDGYIYSRDSDQKTYYTNIKDTDKQLNDIIAKVKFRKIQLDKYKILNATGNSYQVYDQENNDIILERENSKYKNYKIELFNTTSIKGYGTYMARILNNMGFGVVNIFNYETNYENTILYTQVVNKDIENVLTKIFNIQKVSTDIPKNINSVADYLIMLGGDTVPIF